MTKLDTTIELYTDFLQPYPHKNFSAITFFDFFWRGKKIIRFPVPYNLSPWGLTDGSREFDEQSYLAREKKYPEVYYYEVKNVQFYITIQVGILQGYPLDYHFKCWFINFFGREQYFDEEEENIFSLPKYVLKNPSFIPFERFIRKQVFDKVFYFAHKSKNELLSFVEETMGPIEKPEELCHHWTMPTEIIDKIGFSGRNFCLNTPSQIRINLEEHFSFEELICLLKEVGLLGLIKNPFPEKIETSIEEYKTFLLTLLGPGKWEYGNVELEKLELSLEELCLLLLASKLNGMPLGMPWGIKPSKDTFFPLDSDWLIENFHFMEKYFWFRLREVIKD